MASGLPLSVPPEKRRMGKTGRALTRSARQRDSTATHNLELALASDIRALKAYAAAAHTYLHDLRDIARNPAHRDYVRAAAQATVPVEFRLPAGGKSIEKRWPRVYDPMVPESPVPCAEQRPAVG